MIYEVRTYILKPGTVPEFEKRFAETLPHREKYSRLAAFWHTEFGPLNQVVHIWPYEDLGHRTQVRAEASQDPHWPPKAADLIVTMESEIHNPAPFMRPMGNEKLGNIYEMRMYTYQYGAIPEVIKRWGAVIEEREKHSPLAACMYSEIGGLNKWVHIWPYASLEERTRIREEAAKGGKWPAPTRDLMLRQENKLLIPAPFSPMH
ncbi:MAG: NIPSNAP family protein [Chloroflexi bacterium]|nr:NIPSNAP family protein [Chloroflexota bacterium]